LKEDLIKNIEQSKTNWELNKKVFNRLKHKKPKDLDSTFHKKHEAVFKKMDCLNCANCCKTTSPIFRDVDIKRIAKRLKLKEFEFINDHLVKDEDNDWVLKSSPCFFLDENNACRIYEDRPLACREYPHTNRKNMYQILDLTLTNSLICPAVANIVHEISEKYK
jgi:Fe-S-cluster containining protein